MSENLEEHHAQPVRERIVNPEDALAEVLARHVYEYGDYRDGQHLLICGCGHVSIFHGEYTPDAERRVHAAHQSDALAKAGYGKLDPYVPGRKTLELAVAMLDQNAIRKAKEEAWFEGLYAARLGERIEVDMLNPYRRVS